MTQSYDWEAIKAAHPIADVIGGLIPLKKRGHELVGLCPFHAEKSPSFTVSPSKGFYHCFGCGSHGDIVDFIANYKKIEPRDAIMILTGGEEVVMSAENRAERATAMAEREAEQKRQQVSASQKAAQRWEAADAASDDNSYLIRKGVISHGCREENGALLLPIFDSDGNLQSVQSIASDGSKRFQSGAPTKGGRMMIGLHMGRTILCEGYATGASIYAAIPEQTCVTFSKGNLVEVARQLALDGVSIVIAADTNAADEMRVIGRELDCPVIVPVAGSDFNDQEAELGTESVLKTFRDGLLAYTTDKQRVFEEERQEAAPVDLWAQYMPPELPRGLLPPVLEKFAFTRADMMGVDAGGLAMSALTVCGAVITDRIRVKVKAHEAGWHESARLWTMLIGDPSYKKSPIMRAAAGKIASMDGDMLRQYNRDLMAWKDAGEQGDMPAPKRLRIEDITMEAAQEVCVHSPDGVLALQDELSGWFGGIEKYSGGKGSAKDRSFWLRAYGGGEYAVNRISRKSILIDNLSISILGGVQPDAIRKIVHDATDDGLIQRFFPVVLRPALIDRDVEMPDVTAEYEGLVERLHHLKPPSNFFGDAPLQFDDEARRVREELAARHHRFVAATETFNKKLASHLGKFDGMFPRLCVLWHCVEHAAGGSGDLPEFISGDTARRVAAFMSGFITKHSMAFYAGVIGLADDHDNLRSVGGYILAHQSTEVTMRTLQRGSRQMRKLTRDEGGKIFEQLEALGWLEQVNRRSDAPSWRVNPEVHALFADRAERERQQRSDMKDAIQKMIAEGGERGAVTVGDGDSW